MKLIVLALALVLNTNFALADEGRTAITTMGEVNGIALACQQMALVSRARNAVATTAPKTRVNGEIFEEATNASYLEFGNSKKECPDATALVQRLNDAEKRLTAAFAKQ